MVSALQASRVVHLLGFIASALAVALFVTSIFKPWHAAVVGTDHCKDMTWYMSRNWFHDVTFKQVTKYENDQGIPYDCWWSTFAFQMQEKLHLLPRNTVDFIYVATFVLVCSSAGVSSLVMLLSLFRVIRPQYHPLRMRVLHVSFGIVAFIFSLIAILLFTFGVPRAYRHETNTHFRSLFDTSATRWSYDWTRYYYEPTVHTSVVAAYYPAPGWFINVGGCIALLCAVLLGFFVRPKEDAVVANSADEKVPLKEIL